MFEISHLINKVLKIEEAQKSTTDFDKLEKLRRQKKKLVNKMVDIKLAEYKASGNA